MTTAQIIYQSLVFLAALLAWLASRNNCKEIRELKVSVDGRLTQLLEMTALSEKAKGKLAGRAEAKAERGERGKKNRSIT